MSTTQKMTTTTTTTTTTTFSPCYDKHEQCYKMKKYCNHKSHSKRVQEMCPETCEVCPQIISTKASSTTTPSTRTTTTSTTSTTTTSTTETMAQVSKSAIICKDRTPAFCKGKAKFCTQPKAKKTMSYKCQKTCGFCEAIEKQADVDVVEDSNEQKFGPWGAKWSRCVRGSQYVKRSCNVQPCQKRQLYKVKKC